MVDLVKQNLKEKKKIFNNIKRELRKELSMDIPIEHVGSTAIPYMYGKNIIDILIGAEDIREFAHIKKVLEDHNFIGSEKSRDEIYQFFASSFNETGSGDVHIHLVIKNTQRFLDFLILRDYLLKNRKEVRAYSNLKKKIIKDGIIDRKDYKKQKSEYVSNLLNRARKAMKND